MTIDLTVVAPDGGGKIMTLTQSLPAEGPVPEIDETGSMTRIGGGHLALPGTVAVLDVGRGAREALAVPGSGAVVAVFRRAAYLRLPGGLVALVGPEVPPGPLWIRAQGPVPGLHPRDPVTVAAPGLEVAGHRLPIAGGDTWSGPLPEPSRLRAAHPLALDVLTAAPPSSLLVDPWRPALAPAEAAIRRGDLVGAASVLGGLGPGLTPAGDDALAGILLAHRALAGEGVEPNLLAAASAALTTDLSAALLRWAARGQAVEPVHAFLVAVAAGDRRRALTAADRIAALGASSGADLLLGLGLGLVAGRPLIPSERRGYADL